MVGSGTGSARGLIIAAVILALVGVVLLVDGPESEPMAEQRADEFARAPSPAPSTLRATTPSSPTSDPSGGGAHTPSREPASTSTVPSPTRRIDTPPSPTPTLPPGVTRPGPPAPPQVGDVDRTNPSAVAAAALKAMYAMNIGGDAEPEAAVRRAQPWLSRPAESGAYDLRYIGAIVADMGNEWNEHDAYVHVVDVQDQTETGTPRDTAKRALRQFSVHFTPLGRDGWTGTLRRHAWYVTLVRDSGGWRIATLRLA